MRKKCYAAFLLFILCCYYMTGSAYAISGDQIREDKIDEFIDEEMKELVQQGLAKGITVALVKDQEIALCKGYGYADEKKGIPVNPENSTFMIGSVSKVFVPIAAMQLAERGKLDLEVPVTGYLEADFPNFKYPVTMKQLLTHTAGFDFMLSHLESENEKDRMTLKEFVTECQPPQVYQPGEVSNYSNYGIALAGYVIECISGQSFADYAQDNIFGPLNMNFTTYKSEGKGIVSKAYSPLGEEKQDVIVNSYPAGSATTTAHDMAVFMNFLLGEGDQKVITQASKEEIFAQNFSMEKALPGLGYVWMRYERNGHIFYIHDGGTANFTSQIAIFPENKLGVFISSNQINDSKYSLADCIYGIVELLYGKANEEKALSPSKMDDIEITGYYAPTNRSILGPDKLLNVLYYGFTNKISGNSLTGYHINGMKLDYIGNHQYQGKMGKYTFIQRGNLMYYTLNGTNNFLVRVPWYESSQWQILLLLPAVLTLGIGFFIFGIRLIAGIVTGKGRSYNLICIPPVLVFIALGAMILRFIGHVHYMNEVFGGLNCTVGIAGVLQFFRITAAVITVLGFGGIASGIYLWRNRRSMTLCLFHTVWCIAVLLFILWLVQMNLVL